jgi:hypothetical protein
MEATRYLESGLRKRVLDRDGGRCRYCGSKEGPFHLDHVYPFVKGGETSFDNLVTACEGCNQSKHDAVGMWPKPVGYFEPAPKYVDRINIVIYSTSLVASLLMLTFKASTHAPAWEIGLSFAATLILGFLIIFDWLKGKS